MAVDVCCFQSCTATPCGEWKEEAVNHYKFNLLMRLREERVCVCVCVCPRLPCYFRLRDSHAAVTHLACVNLRINGFYVDFTHLFHI